MEADQEKLRLEAESEMLAEAEMTPEVEARLVRTLQQQSDATTSRLQTVCRQGALKSSAVQMYSSRWT